jgi:WD40 repeat protein
MEGTVRLWDVPSGHLRATLPASWPGANVVALSPDGRTLAAGGIEPTVWLWDVAAVPGPPIAATGP